MVSTSRSVSLLACLFLLVQSISLFSPTDADAARRRNKRSGKDKVVDEADLSTTTLELKGRRGTKSYDIVCYKGAAGILRTSAKGLKFVSYGSLRSQLQKTGKKQRKQKLYGKLSKSGKGACAAAPPVSEIGHLSLSPHTGAFDAAAARHLLDRFAFGASPSRVNQAVSDGLERTILKLTTPVNEPTLDAVFNDLLCDARYRIDPITKVADPNNRVCNPNNPNDLDLTGLRYGVYERLRHTQNPFLERLLFFLHDERMAASLAAVAGRNDYHAALEHYQLLRQAAYSGDFRRFIERWSTDQLGNLQWLDGALNRGDSPNENFAREFWELGTTGPTALDGTPVYTDQDIANGALAFSGWTLTNVSIPNPMSGGENFSARYPSFTPFYHRFGSKIVFRGTPWEAIVDDHSDMVAATMAHPRTAEHLAEDIWREFINPYATPEAIRQLAAVIVQNDFKLLPVFQTIMRSRAIFDARSRKSIIKHPIDLMVGFTRSTGYPISVSEMESFLGRLGQRPLLPNSIFGWDPVRLAQGQYVVEWRNFVTRMMNDSVDKIRTNRSYDLHQVFVSPLSGVADPAGTFVTQLADRFNLPLSAEQQAAVARFVKYDRIICQTYYDDCSAPGQFFLRLREFDAATDNIGYADNKAQGAIAIMLTLPEYRLK